MEQKKVEREIKENEAIQSREELENTKVMMRCPPFFTLEPFVEKPR